MRNAHFRKKPFLQRLAERLAKTSITVMMFFVTLLGICAVVVLLPMLLVAHVTLRVVGRHGCIFEQADGRVAIKLCPASFRRSAS